MSHALLSPSSADRWIHCPPSAVINAQAEDRDTVYTREGTLAHALAELKGRKHFLGMGPQKYGAELRKLKKDELWADEMDGHTDTWLDTLKTLYAGFVEKPYIALEQKVDFSEYVPDGFGTADCIMIGGNTLHIVDFKYGKGVEVSEERNPQLMLYALGALLQYRDLYDITYVGMSIVQPRVRSESGIWEMEARDLLQWAEDVVAPAAKLAAAGEGEYQSGDWCRWCAIRGSCRARAEANLELARMEFKPAPELTDAEIGEALEAGRHLKAWLSDLEDYALDACLDGREIAGWKAVEGRAVRTWTDPEAAFTAAREAGVPEAMLYERKPVTLAALEKIMGKRQFLDALGVYVTTPPGKPTLVKSDDRRQAITNRTTAKQDFEEE